MFKLAVASLFAAFASAETKADLPAGASLRIGA